MHATNCDVSADNKKAQFEQVIYLQSLTNTPISDLTPLKGMPLINLNITGCTQISDLTPLKGMPLTTLNLSGCAQINDLSPLQDSPLKILNALGCGEKCDLAPLRHLKLTELVALGSHLKGLGVLKEMPLTSLSLSGCEKTFDFTPIRQHAGLTSLALMNCPGLSDLGFLEGLQLSSLTLNGSSVRSLSGLKGMPLAYLDLTDCKDLNDLTPLAGKKLLNWISLPPNVTKGIEAIRSVAMINGGPAEQFWKKWEAAKAKAK